MLPARQRPSGRTSAVTSTLGPPTPVLAKAKSLGEYSSSLCSTEAETSSGVRASWERAGGQLLNGLDLLVHQAVLQVELMTHQIVPHAQLETAMRTAGVQALAARRAAADQPR